MSFHLQRIYETPTDALVDEWMHAAPGVDPRVLLAALEQAPTATPDLGGMLGPGLGGGRSGVGLRPPEGLPPTVPPGLPPPAAVPNVSPMLGGAQMLLQAGQPRPAAPPPQMRLGGGTSQARFIDPFSRRSFGDLIGGR